MCYFYGQSAKKKAGKLITVGKTIITQYWICAKLANL